MPSIIYGVFEGTRFTLRSKAVNRVNGSCSLGVLRFTSGFPLSATVEFCSLGRIKTEHLKKTDILYGS